MRDELILALDLYVNEGRNPRRESIRRMSELLRAIPIEPELTANTAFRNESAVQLKLYNFVALDPDAETAGMARGGRRDAQVWDEFARDRGRLSAAAAAIRANLTAVTPRQAEVTEEEIEDAPEGRLLTRVHRQRERSAKLVERKKAAAMRVSGRLECEGCGFDFATTYGERGEGFIECHHTVPVSELKPGSRTRPEDLALVCSNCHRMIHRRGPWLTMDRLRALVVECSASSSALRGSRAHP